MSKIYLSSKGQLKCNFCTMWFSASSQFSILQKYCLNACPNCLKNFNYTLVSSLNYEVYDVLLLNAGFNLGLRETELDQKLEHRLHQQQQTGKMSLKEAQAKKEAYYRLKDLVTEVSNRSNDAKERVSQIYRKIIHQLLQSWQQSCEELSQDLRKMETLLEAFIDNLGQKTLQNSQQELHHKFFKISQKSIAVNTDQVMRSIQEDFEANVKNYKYDNEIAKNRRSDKGKMLRSQRSKGANKENNYLQANQIATVKRAHSKSIRKDSDHLEVTCSGFEPLGTIRKSHSTKQFMVESDDYYLEAHFGKDKDQISALLKGKNNFESYFEEYIPREDCQVSKKLGAKSMIQNLYENLNETRIDDHICEKIGGNFTLVNFDYYLRCLKIPSGTSVLRLVKTKLQDNSFDYLLDFLGKKDQFQILIVTNNQITLQSLIALRNFKKRHPKNALNTVYMGNNYIKHSQAVRLIEELDRNGIHVLL